MIAIVFEYARPGSFVSGLNVLRLNSLIPLSLVVVCMFSSGVRPMKEVMRDPAAKWLAAYVCVIALSLLHANFFLALEIVRTTFGYLLLAFAVARICTTAEHIRGVFAALVLSHLFLLVMNPAALTNPEQRNYITGGVFLGDGNDFALSICIILPMAIELALASKSRFQRWFWFLAVLLLALAIIATQSRGGTLGMMAVGVTLWLRSNRKGPMLVAFLVVIAVAFVYAPEQYFGRMRTLANYEANGSAMGRIMAWKAAIQMFLDNPLLGVGAGGFNLAYGTMYRPEGVGFFPWLTAHSMYFLVLGELGLPGIGALLALVVGNIWLSRRVSRRQSPQEDAKEASPFPTGPVRLLYLLNASMVGLGVAGAFLSVSYYPHIFFLSALMLAARGIVQIELREPAVGPARGAMARARALPRTRTSAAAPRSDGDGTSTRALAPVRRRRRA